MPILFQKVIRRDDLRRNPDALYVFGDNVARIGHGGQAAQMRGERNAVGVRTKYHPKIHFAEAPAETLAQKRMIDQDMMRLFDHLKIGGIVVWPADGIGTGLARLPETAPTTFAYLEDKLAALLQVARLG